MYGLNIMKVLSTGCSCIPMCANCPVKKRWRVNPQSSTECIKRASQMPDIMDIMSEFKKSVLMNSDQEDVERFLAVFPMAQIR